MASITEAVQETTANKKLPHSTAKCSQQKGTGIFASVVPASSNILALATVIANLMHCTGFCTGEMLSDSLSRGTRVPTGGAAAVRYGRTEVLSQSNCILTFELSL